MNNDNNKTNKKIVLYSTLQFLSLGGKLYTSSGELLKKEIRLDVMYRNEYPRFVITIDNDVTKSYFDRTKTVPMSAQILLYVSNAISGLMHEKIVVKYPDFDDKDRTPIEIAQISVSDNDKGIRELHITFDDKKAIFPITPDNTFYMLVDTRTNENKTYDRDHLLKFADYYATSLKDTAVLAAMLYGKQNAYEKEVE